jgi:hypothetical protein
MSLMADKVAYSASIFQERANGTDNQANNDDACYYDTRNASYNQQ